MDPDFVLARTVADSADRLISSQVFMSGGGTEGSTRNVTKDLYDAARRVQGEPLVYLAARALVEKLKPRDAVIICSGFFDPPSMVGEADGPLGAALLARSLCVAFDITPVFLTEVTHMSRTVELANAVGLEVVDFEIARTTPYKAAILPLPIDDARARKLAKSTFDRIQPAAMISTEKPSPSRAGTVHTGIGLDVTGVTGRVEHFVAEAQARKVLTIGVGDGGNEVGMGMIYDDVCEIVPTGKIMGTVVSSDILIVAAAANWGTYALEACIAAALHMPDALHSLADERRATEATARAGLIDPCTGLANGWVDGTPPIVSESFLEILRQMVLLRLDKKVPQAATNFPARWRASGVADKTIAIWAKKLAEEEREFLK